MSLTRRFLLPLLPLLIALAGPAQAQTPAQTPAQTQPPAALVFGVGLFQPDREKNDATYRPLAEHLAQRLGRPVQLRTVDSWEGLARSLANGETDIALLGPWGYVLANHEAGAQVVATILYEGKPEYHALIVTHPGSGLNSSADLLGPKGRGAASPSATRARPRAT
jgi:phosphonate transport system substrate-binding protein